MAIFLPIEASIYLSELNTQSIVNNWIDEKNGELGIDSIVNENSAF